MKSLYLIFKRYRGMAFAEITMIILIALLSLSFTYSLCYVYEASANVRYADRVIGEDVALFYYNEDVIRPDIKSDEDYLERMDLFQDIYDSQTMKNAVDEIISDTGAEGVSRLTLLPVDIQDWAKNPNRSTAWTEALREYDHASTRTVVSYDPLTLKNLPIDLREGRWFTDEEAEGINLDDENAEIPVIMSMDWDECYEIGDVFYAVMDQLDLKANEDILDEINIPKAKMKFKVIGKFKKGAYYYRMQNITDQFLGAFGRTDLVVGDTSSFMIAPELTVNGKLCSTVTWPSIEHDIGFVFAKDAQSKVGEWNNSATKQYGQFVSVREIAEKTKEEFQSGSRTYILHTIIFGVMLLINLYGYNLMLIRKQKKAFAVYFASGMTWKRGLGLCLTGNLLVFVISGILGSIAGVSVVNTVREMTQDTNLLAALSSMGGIFVIFLISSAFTAYYMAETDPTELLSGE